MTPLRFRLGDQRHPEAEPVSLGAETKLGACQKVVQGGVRGRCQLIGQLGLGNTGKDARELECMF